MTFDEVIALLEAEGGVRGATSRHGQFWYGARGLNFVACCGSDDRAYNRHEFIAVGPHGGRSYLCLNRETRLISCGPRGYHHTHPDVPACV